MKLSGQERKVYRDDTEAVVPVDSVLPPEAAVHEDEYHDHEDEGLKIGVDATPARDSTFIVTSGYESCDV